MKNLRRKKSRTISASELAQMGVCERLVVFEHKYGKRPSPEQREGIQRGLIEHERFYQDGIQTSAKRGRCYIATLVYGESRETTTLRLFREQVLRPYTLGRGLIKLYYRTAPGICLCLEHWPWLQPVAGWILRPLVRLADHMLRERRSGHVNWRIAFGCFRRYWFAHSDVAAGTRKLRRGGTEMATKGIA